MAAAERYYIALVSFGDDQLALARIFEVIKAEIDSNAKTAWREQGRAAFLIATKFRARQIWKSCTSIGNPREVLIVEVGKDSLTFDQRPADVFFSQHGLGPSHSSRT